jgi:hypothetical protein
MQITIQHFELVRLLCRPRLAGSGPDAQVAAALLEQQCTAVRSVRHKCLRLIARRGEPRPLSRFTRH